MIAQTLKWVGGIDGYLELIDQRRLPAELVKIQCSSVEQLYEAIGTLAVRGAPAIGVAAAYGLVIALQNLDTRCLILDALECLKKASEKLSSARPTAVNLFWALDRVRQKAEDFVADKPPASPNRGEQANLQALQEVVLAEANAICREDVDMCSRIGLNGERFIKEGAGILTHCNAGALATAGQGTALSVMYEAKKKRKRFKVYVDETRPLLQGARLTAWELKQAGIEAILICDNMAGWLMKQGKIDAVITGADRIAANGDAANKIGTYSLSILAREHGVPFYIAAPLSTFDLSIKSGAEIPIEQRAAEEVVTFPPLLLASARKLQGRINAEMQIAPDGISVYNPSFDVTEAKDITAIITDKGIIEKPNAKKIFEHLGGARTKN
jgi:methylthioribose-1-phosphate isomerase